MRPGGRESGGIPTQRDQEDLVPSLPVARGVAPQGRNRDGPAVGGPGGPARAEEIAANDPGLPCHHIGDAEVAAQAEDGEKREAGAVGGPGGVGGAGGHRREAPGGPIR